MTTPLHLLAYALYPKYYHSKYLSLPSRTAPKKDSEVVQGYKTTLRKIYRDVGTAMEVRAEFGAFVQSTGGFSDPTAMNDRGHIDPITWWGFHGGKAFISQLWPPSCYCKLLVPHLLREIGVHMASSIR